MFMTRPSPAANLSLVGEGNGLFCIIISTVEKPYKCCSLCLSMTTESRLVKQCNRENLLKSLEDGKVSNHIYCC